MIAAGPHGPAVLICSIRFLSLIYPHPTPPPLPSPHHRPNWMGANDHRDRSEGLVGGVRGVSLVRKRCGSDGPCKPGVPSLRRGPKDPGHRALVKAPRTNGSPRSPDGPRSTLVRFGKQAGCWQHPGGWKTPCGTPEADHILLSLGGSPPAFRRPPRAARDPRQRRDIPSAPLGPDRPGRHAVRALSHVARKALAPDAKKPGTRPGG